MIELTSSWNLRSVMAARGIFQTTKIGPLLAERGIDMSREQVYRLVTQPPQYVRLDVLVALCDALDCTFEDLVHTERHETTQKIVNAPEQTRAGVGNLRPVAATIRRPNLD